MATAAPSCPVDGVRIDEHVVRLIAAQVIILAALAAWFRLPLLTAVLVADFCLRAFSFQVYSPLRFTAAGIASFVKWLPKPTNAAPKRFAAQLGWIVTGGLLFSQLLELDTIALAITGLLIVFALLESVFAICVGCIIYQYLTQIRVMR